MTGDAPSGTGNQDLNPHVLCIALSRVHGDTFLSDLLGLRKWVNS